MSEYTNEVVKIVSETKDRNGSTEKMKDGQYIGIKGNAIEYIQCGFPGYEAHIQCGDGLLSNTPQDHEKIIWIDTVMLKQSCSLSGRPREGSMESKDYAIWKALF